YPADARENGYERPDDREKPAHDEREHAMPQVYFPRDLQVFFSVEKAFFSSVKVILGPISESIADGGATYSSQDHQQDQQPHGRVDMRRIGEESRHKQQLISRKKKTEKQPGFSKNDHQ